jgi:hypothetical protein
MTPVALAAALLVSSTTFTAGPVVTNFACDSAGGTVSCYVTHAGGTAPVSILWTWNGLHRGAWDNRTSVFGNCQVGFSVEVGVRLFDSTGGGDGREVTTACRRGNP